MTYRDKNGTVTYRIWDGGEKVRTVRHRARITPKRFALPGFSWNGDGLQLSPEPRAARTITRVIAYQIDGQPEVTL